MKKRFLILFFLVVVGALSGWLTFNLLLDYLLGGKLF
jgi:hypothetical protein